jgi:ParB family chromosome partitioning protein
MTETKRLGRGLEALLGPVSREQAEASGALRELPMTSLRPNPFQPRTRIDEAELTDLANSMQASGLLQPVIVRPRDGGYELIAGERRWRAAERLGWPKIPAVVREVDDRTLLTLALVENLQRDDLSPIDEAAGYRRLGEEFHLGQAEIARAVGRDRSTVANLLRLLQLPPDVQTMVHEKRLSAGHARALLGLADADRQSALAAEAIEQEWSVREIEAAVAGKRTIQRPAKRAGGPPAPRGVTADVKRVEDALRKRLGTDVRVTARRRGRGFVTISYYSNDDLSRLLELILGGPFEG